MVDAQVAPEKMDIRSFFKPAVAVAPATETKGEKDRERRHTIVSTAKPASEKPTPPADALSIRSFFKPAAISTDAVNAMADAAIAEEAAAALAKGEEMDASLSDAPVMQVDGAASDAALGKQSDLKRMDQPGEDDAEDDNEDEEDDEDEDEDEDDNESDQLSAYEQMRLENIKRNEALLAQLGLHGATAQLADRVERQKKPGKRKRAPKAIEPAAPTRRSSRKRGGGPVAYTEEAMMAAAASAAAHAEAMEEAEAAVEEEVDYDDSSVVRYTCDASGDSSEGASTDPGPSMGRIVGFRRRAAEGELGGVYDSELSRTYSMRISRDNSLLAAAGHGGRVSLFGIHPQNAQEDPLLSWKAHKGWVCSPKLRPHFHTHPYILFITVCLESLGGRRGVCWHRC